jgi:hypothetical protein
MAWVRGLRYLELEEGVPMLISQVPSLWRADPVEAARVAIWRLFEEGYVDEDMATASLLAVDLGTRRRRKKMRVNGHVHAPPPDRKAPAA